jgi:hypothetical protein
MVTWPPSLTIEIAPVLRLFTGENFYSSSDASIREAVLNAVDAVGRRRSSEPIHQAEIEVVFDENGQTVTISDNGDGMDQADLSQLFAKVGASASRMAAEAGKTRAVGEFGIGALSYFLVCDRYEVHTLKQGATPIGLEFSSAMLNGEQQAKELVPTRTSIGTTLVFHLKSPDLFDLLLKRFSHWMRNVSGLRAWTAGPDRKEIQQGGLTRQVHQVTAPTVPEWIEAYELGPPEELGIWDSYDGRGSVDVLYRGVFVERVQIDQLWGLEGAVHVDPKHFRPKLNREGFVGTELNNEITPFLRDIHPNVLERAVECVHDLLQSREHWNLSKAISLWLAVPRSPKYAAAAKAWDDEFRYRKTFRLLTALGDREVSISELIDTKSNEIFLAPDQLNETDAIGTQAIRILRAQGQTVVQGLQRASGYLGSVTLSSESTSWLLLHAFKSELPAVTETSSVALKIVAQQSIETILQGPPRVLMVQLGPRSAPLIAVGNEIWINVETPTSQLILAEMFRRNEGHLGLWIASMLHAPDQGQTLDQIGALIRRLKPAAEALGVVRREYLRALLK